MYLRKGRSWQFKFGISFPHDTHNTAGFTKIGHEITITVEQMDTWPPNLVTIMSQVENLHSWKIRRLIHLRLRSNQSMASKWRGPGGHTVATTSLLRGHCQTCWGCPETNFCVFQQDCALAHQHTTPSLCWSERRVVV